MIIELLRVTLSFCSTGGGPSAVPDTPISTPPSNASVPTSETLRQALLPVVQASAGPPTAALSGRAGAAGTAGTAGPGAASPASRGMAAGSSAGRLPGAAGAAIPVSGPSAPPAGAGAGLGFQVGPGALAEPMIALRPCNNSLLAFTRCDNIASHP